MKRTLRVASALTLGVSLALLFRGCGDPDACQGATVGIQTSIVNVCKELAFKDSPFCTCCVPAGLYSIDDTCTCQPLIFDADFCYYKNGTGGYPSVRAALQYASSVCLDRPVAVPYASSKVDGGMCVASTRTSNDAGTSDSGTGDAPTE